MTSGAVLLSGMAFWRDPQNVATLLALWAAGVSTSEIARRMRVSKNAVVGKAHRLGLPDHPAARRPTEVPTEELVRLQKLRWTQKRIAAHFGVSRQMVSLRLIKQYQVDYSRRMTGSTLPPLPSESAHAS